MDALRSYYGIDQPLAAQFVGWLGNFVTGNLGVSQRTGQSVLDMTASSLPVTLELALLATAWESSSASPWAFLASVNGSRCGGAIRRSGGAVHPELPARCPAPDVHLPGRALQPQCHGLRQAHGGARLEPAADDAAGPRARFRVGCAHHAYLTLGAIRGQGRGLRPHGPGQRRLAAADPGPPCPHNALVPIVTIIGIQFGYLLGGAVIVEQTFSVPGIGRQFLIGMQQKEYAIVRAPSSSSRCCSCSSTLSPTCSIGSSTAGTLGMTIDEGAMVASDAAVTRRDSAWRRLLASRSGSSGRPSRACARRGSAGNDWIYAVRPHRTTRGRPDPGTVVHLLVRDRPVRTRHLLANHGWCGIVLQVAVVAVDLSEPGDHLRRALRLLRQPGPGPINALTNMLFAFPPLLLALALASVATRNWFTVAAAIAIVYIPIFVRVTRAPVLSLKEADFIKAARVLGFPTRRIRSATSCPISRPSSSSRSPSRCRGPSSPQRP